MLQVIQRITLLAAAWLNQHGFLSEEEAVPSDASKNLLQPAVFADGLAETYQVGKMIGEGGFAVVRECLHRYTGARFAVKILQQDKTPRTRIQNEIAAMMRIKHTNCLPLVDVFVEDSIYIVMDLMTGGTVLDRIVEMDFYSEADARDVIMQVLTALAYLHSCGSARE